jgi:hypothetical protein
MGFDSYYNNSLNNDIMMDLFIDYTRTCRQYI